MTSPRPGARASLPLLTASLLALPLVAGLLAGCHDRETHGKPAAARTEARPFAWPAEQPAPAVRGEPEGDAGLPVVLAASPSEAWKSVTALPPGADRDRAAVRALAGDFRVTFDFQEVVSLRPGQALAAPYHSWATERVFIIEDSPTRISLQHQLVIRSAAKPQEAMVVKHWREDWTWQDARILSFQGLGSWNAVARDAQAEAGRWSQAVYGVNDEPRFESSGVWRHDGGTSQWISERQLRPLPRREYSKRKDYQALDGVHRITITPTGWVQWQDNVKLPLSAPGTPVAEGPLAIEIGCTRYERIAGFDWTPGVTAWEAESAYWTTVRAAWDERIAKASGSFDRDAVAAEIEKEVGDPPSEKAAAPAARAAK